MALANAIKLTYDDYCLMPVDGKRHEIIDGAHVVSPAPKTRHQQILRNLVWYLESRVREDRSGQLFFAPCDVVLSDFDVVQPDLIFVGNQRADIVTDTNIQGAPDLVVEVLSESTRRTDEITKRKLFEQSGVGEYWIIDPVLDTIKVYRVVDGAYDRTDELALERGDALQSPLFPDFILALRDLFPAR